MKLTRLVLDLLANARLARRRPMLEPGDPVPDCVVRAHDGSDVRLADYAGRRIILWFYPKADTPG